jgi:predicted O-methyltransferase YrrM
MILPPFDAEATEREICELLASLVRVYKPHVIVEAGTYRGHSALMMADACRKNGHGGVITYDPIDHGIQEYIDRNDLWEWLEYEQAPYAPLIEQDFAFIDASACDETGRMSAAVRWEHWRETEKRLSPGGVICAHDTLHPAAPWYDGEGGASMYRIRDASTLNIDRLRGLSVYQKPC